MRKLITVSIVASRRKLELLSVYVKPNIKERLEAWAEKEDRSISWIVARLIEEALEQDRDKQSNE